MDQTRQPSKQAVREWLQARLAVRSPPPDPQQIRRELGWEMVRQERGEMPYRLAD
jgi:glycosyltransferase A (GT-A) superfamily protein (DUF2064 family)